MCITKYNVFLLTHSNNKMTQWLYLKTPHTSASAFFEASLKKSFLDLQPEMMTVLGVGVSPDRVLCACTIKCPSHLKFASEHGVNIMTFDSAEELVKMKDQNAR